MKIFFTFIIALLLSQQYLNAQNITTTYSLPGVSADAQTQKIMVRPNNPDEQVVLSRDGNTSYFYLIPPDRGMAQRIEINSNFIVNDFDLFGDTIIFCGKRTNNGADRAFIGVATFQSLFNNTPSWIPIVDNQVTFLERVLLYRDGTALCAACYANGNPVIYKYTGSFTNISNFVYDLGIINYPTLTDTVLITDFVETKGSIVYVGMLNHVESSVNLYKLDKNSSFGTPIMKKIAELPNSCGNGGVITQLNRDSIILAISDWNNLETNVYVIDINNLSNVSRQRIRGYEEKNFPIDIVYNSDEKEIIYLQHSALHLFDTERRDALYRLEAFPNGNYQADVVYNQNSPYTIPTAVFRYNSIDLINREKAIICGRDFNSGLIALVEQMINRMSDVSNICIEHTLEQISVSNINLTSQQQALMAPQTPGYYTYPTITGNYSTIGITINCQE